MFITGPSHPCPRCGQLQLGTLSITGNVHSRRCQNCYHDENEHMPPLAKKLIYLDQMAISKIAMRLDPVWRKEKPNQDNFWLEAFDQIDRLVKLQLIVCPESPFHKKESSYTPYERELRRLYEHLASGVKLRSHNQVLMVQLAEAFEAWSTDRDPDWTRITREDVTKGNLDQWSDRLCISVDMGHLPGQIKSRRESRGRVHETLKQLWVKWKNEKKMPFKDRFEDERRGLAVAVLQSYNTYVERIQASSGAEDVTDLSHLTPRWPAQTVISVLRCLEKLGVPQEDQLREAERFLHSEPALCAPQNHLSALLVASLAWRAASGQKRVPGRGTLNDINFISAYLPYCDAMFIDNEFAQLLREGQLAATVKDYPTRIFSARTKKDFLAYLHELEEKAEPTHVELVARTYGETWTEPYRSMLEHERMRQPPPDAL